VYRRNHADSRIEGQHAFDYIDFVADFSGRKNSCLRGRMASFTRAFAALQEPASPVFGPRSSIILAADKKYQLTVGAGEVEWQAIIA